MSVAAQAPEVFDVTDACVTMVATFAVMLTAGMKLFEVMPVAKRAGHGRRLA